MLRPNLLLLALLLPQPAHAASGGLAFVEPLATSLVFRSSQAGAVGLAQGDFNGDGNLDLAVTGRSDLNPPQEGGFIYVLLGRGDGTFGTPSKTAVPRTANDQQAFAGGLLAKDFDGDDELDLVTVSEQLREVIFLKGLGNGSFGPLVRSATTNPYNFVQPGDVDGDEVLDVVALGSHSLEILKGGADGSFTSLAVRSVANVTDAVVRDIDGDDDLDIVLSQWETSEMLAYFNQGEGQFATTGTVINNGGKQTGGFFMGRFDGDAIDDIVATGPFGCDGWVILRGLGGGSFKVPGANDCIRGVVTPTTYGIKRFSENTAFDLDGDGDDDPIFFGPGNTFERGLQRADGGFDLDMWAMTPGPGYDHNGHGAVDCLAARSMVAGDFNGDDVIDIVVAGENGNGCRAGGVSIVLGAPQSRYRSPRFQRARTEANLRGFLLDDFIEDGHLDLLVQRPQAVISRGRGDGTFEPQGPTIPGATCQFELNGGDFDNDSHADFACVSNFGSDAVVAFGDGAGGFEAFPMGSDGEARQIMAGDFNGDGFTDFGVLTIHGCNAICSAANVHLWLADPQNPRTFTKFPQVVEYGPPDGKFAYGIAAGDFNHDGRLDIVFHSGRAKAPLGVGEDRFMVSRGNGDGSFLPPLTTLEDVLFVADFKPYDFDRDGRLDLLAVNSGGMYIMRGNGDATFQSAKFYSTTAGNGFEAEIADLDGDGLEDVVLSSGYFGFSSPLSVFKGNGDATFQTRRRFASGRDATTGIEVGDVNEDGRLDIVAQLTAGDRPDNFVVILGDNDLPDLEVTQVGAPPSAVPGEMVTLTYTARNAGPNLADGEWDDLVYLSADDTLDKDDLLIGTVHQVRQLGVNATYQGSISMPLPGELPGMRRVLVVADGNGNLGEAQEDDNQGSAALTVGEVPLLVEDVATMGTIRAGEFRYFRYVPQPGSALLFSVTFEVGNQAELYTRFDRLPSRTHFDKRYEIPNDTLQTLSVPSTLDGTYYVLIYGSAAAGAGGRPFSITARELGLSIISLSRVSGSNAGKVSFTIGGAKFTAETNFTLVSGATVREPVDVAFVSSDRVDVTFDLAGLETGLYDVVASDGDRLFTLPNGFTVTSGPPGRIEAKLSMPFNVRVNATGTATVTLRNTGETDAPYSWFRLHVTSDNAALLLSDGTESEEIFFGPDGTISRVPPSGQGGGASVVAPTMTALGTFGPGAEATITCPFRCTSGMEGDVRMELEEISRPEDSLDPEQMKRDLKPSWAPAAAWDAVWNNFTGRAGSDLKQLPKVLSDSAKHYASVGAAVRDIRALLMLELERAGLTRIAGRYLEGSFGRGRPAPWDVVATTDEDGTAHLRLGPAVRSFSRRATGEYRGSPGEIATLSFTGGAYTLREGDGNMLRFRNDGKLDYIEDANGNRITYNYSGGRAVSRTFTNGDQETFGYGPSGFVSTVTDAVGRMTTFTYDGDGHLLTEFGPLDGTTTYTYDLSSNPATRHAVTSITTPDDVTQSFSYDPVNGELRHTEKSGGIEAFDISYPTSHCQRTGSAQGSTTICRNPRGQPARVTDGLGRLITNRFDVAGNLIRTTWADGSATVYGRDRNGNVNLLTARDGVTATELVWHPFLNRLTRVRDPRDKTTVYGIDAKGNLTGITDALGREETVVYDARGRLREVKNRRNQTTLYDYNNSDELISRTPPGQAPIVFAYHPTREVSSVTDPSGTTMYDYDLFGRLERIEEPSGRSLEFDYDEANRRIRSTDQDGFVVKYEYDNAGRLWKVTDAQDNPWVTYSYDNSSRLMREDKGNATYTTYGYDTAGRLERIENRGVGGILQSFFQYGYDIMDRPETLTTAEGVTRFEYDLLDQLKVIRLPGGRVIQYDYDAAGNRRSVNDGGSTTNYSVNDLNEYTSVGNTSYTYDNDGNLLTRSGGFTFGFDAGNQLTSVGVSGTSRTYEYSDEGFLRRRTLNGVPTFFQSDPLGLINLVGEYDAAGEPTAHYVHGLGLVARVDANGTTYYGYEGAGTTVQLTDATGSPVNQYDHLPFGERRSAGENVPQAFTFGGAGGLLRDGQLHWARARWYDPSIGRFISQDPLGVDSGDLNLYRYAGNSPVLNSDPSGTSPGSFLPPPGPALVTQTAVEVLVESTPAFEYGAYGYGSGALSGSSSAVGTAEALAARGELEVARQAIQLAPKPVPPANGVANMTTRLVTRNGVNTLGRTGLSRIGGLALRGLGTAGLVGYTSYKATRFAAENTKAGRAMDNYVTKKFYSRYTDEYLHPKDKTLDDKILHLAAECALFPDTPRCKLYLERVRVHDQGKTRKTRSRDPNAISGPQGFGPENWIAPEQPFPYTIQFENVAAATAAAAEVRIEQTLDADLDPATFEFTGFGWAAVRIDLEPGTTSVKQRVDVRDTVGLYVDVEATFDAATRVMRWYFKSIDPNTGELHPSDGFLLPNDDSGRGDGFVSYRVRPRVDSTTGTVIDAAARIVFDDNEAIDTPAIFHTLDGEGPTSAVQMLAAMNPGGQIQLAWSGMDAIGSGLATYTVWVSVDGEPYYQVLAATTQTSTVFTGEIGKTYRFYVVATDNAGNRETTPVEADATTLVVAPVTPSPVPTVTPTPLTPACAGDCDLSNTVTVDELVTGVSIALGARPATDCLPFDTSKDGAVTVDEILQAVNAALGGCAGRRSE